MAERTATELIDDLGLPTIERALVFATEAHAGQVDKAGRPYIFHPVGVAASLLHTDAVHVCVALLHDVVEDTPVTIEEIEEEFGEEVAGPVALLTKPDPTTDPGTPTDDAQYDAYLDGICADPVAARVKLADLRHNLSRLEHLDDETADRLRRRYEPREARLRAVVEANPLG